jgi:hypothetical protein
METNVSTLLREFPKVRRAALAGEKVVIHTREGDLLLTVAPAKEQNALGCLAGMVLFSDDTIDQPTTQEPDWLK